jgi:ATP-dependent DNA ligase
MQRKIQAHSASLPKTQASFIEPMKYLPVAKLPEDSNFVREIKLDGYRALAVRSGSGPGQENYDCGLRRGGAKPHFVRRA